MLKSHQRQAKLNSVYADRFGFPHSLFLQPNYVYSKPIQEIIAFKLSQM